MKRLALALLLLTALASVVVLVARPGAEASPDVTITVTSTADSGPGTLRQALLDAQSGDTIVFDTTVFPPGSPATISLASMLPTLSTGNVTVDGSTAGVIIDGVSRIFNCFDITSNSNTIKGLEMYNCPNSVEIHGGAQSNTIGGTTPGERNVIAGGVWIYDTGTSGNVVKGNYIGTDASGTVELPGEYGWVAIDGAQSNTIGGSATEERNIIAHGVYLIGASGNVVKGNYIGTDSTGTVALPNWDGVRIFSGAENNTVGGSTSGEGNVIAFNYGDGVKVEGASTIGNTIRGNSIHSNGGKGIENINGGNTELAAPIIDGVGSVSGHTEPVCYPCTVEVFSDDEDEGRIYHGSTTTNDDATGTWTYPGAVTGPNITATITDADGNTSEFSIYSPPIPVGGIAELPDASGSAGRNYIALAAAAAAVVALSAGAWYAGRRRLG